MKGIKITSGMMIFMQKMQSNLSSETGLKEESIGIDPEKSKAKGR